MIPKGMDGISHRWRSGSALQPFREKLEGSQCGPCEMRPISGYTFD